MTAVDAAVVVTDVVARFGGRTVFGAVDNSGVRRRYVAPSSVSAPSPGESWSVKGMLSHHPEHGLQVEVDRMVPARPTGRLVRAVLAGPRFPGIGEATATRLQRALGDRLGDVLDRGDASALIAALGNHDRGRGQVATILEGWPEIGAGPGLMAWADRHGLAPSLVRKLVSCYGAEALQLLQDDPYRLLAFAGWRETDAVASAAGVGPHDLRRLLASCEAALYALLDQGHTWATDAALRSRVARLVGADHVDAAIAAALDACAIVDIDGGWQAAGPRAIEREVAERLADLIGRTERPSARLDMAAFIADWQRSRSIDLNEGQVAAVDIAVSHGLSLVTGGAGTGKTTVLQAVFDAATAAGLAVEAMALSGRAALRIREATGRQARTIAGWLAAVERGEINLRSPTLVVVDEASMVDLPSLHRVLRALGPACRLLMTGDPGQLAPVGFGLTLHVLERCDRIPRVELTHVMRQAAATGIPGAAAAIRVGTMPDVPAYDPEADQGVSLLACAPGDVTDEAVALRRSLPGARIVGSIRGRGAADGGTIGINARLHDAWIAAKTLPDVDFAPGEPVIWTVNDYDLDLWNGNLGRVIGPRTTDLGPALDVEFDDGLRTIPADQLRHLDLAWAITTHKAQGSSFDTVIVPIVRSAIMDRTLLYTAVTRAKRRVILVGDPVELRAIVAGLAHGASRGTALPRALQAAVDAVHEPLPAA